jgi:hypothetical protein
MYVRTTTRKNKDGSVVRYLQLAESVWDAENRRSQTRVLHNLGREDELDGEALRRLARSLLRVSSSEDLERLQSSDAVPRLRLEWAKEYGGVRDTDGAPPWSGVQLAKQKRMPMVQTVSDGHNLTRTLFHA